MSAPWEGSPRPPRRWQVEALSAVGAALRRGERPLVRAATGSGKAQLIAELASSMRRDGEVVVVVAPRQSLVEQLSGVEDLPALRPGSVAWRAGLQSVGVYYGRQKVRTDAPIVVTCTPSLGALAAEIAGRPVRCLIVDEAHLSEADGILAAVEVLRPRYVVGLSATPWRTAEGEALSLFSSEVYTYGITQAQKDGVLCQWETVGVDPSWGQVDADDACARLIREYGDGPGIVSARSIADAEAYALRLTADGIPAQAIHSQLGRREQAQRISALLAGEVRCLVHVALLTTGTDIPELRWICLRRPSSTAIRYVQEIGRVLRTARGKRRALVLDPYDFEGSIGVVHDSRLGESMEQAIAKEAAERTERDPDSYADDEPMPPVVAVSRLTRWARAVILAALDAGVPCEPLPGGRWRSTRPSDKQLNALRRVAPVGLRGVIADTLTRGEVSDLLGACFALRQGRGLFEAPPIPSGAAQSLAAK